MLKDTTAESLGNIVKLGGRPLVQGIPEGIENMPLFDDPQSVDELFDLYQVRYMLKDAPAQDIEAAREEMKIGTYNSEEDSTETLIGQMKAYEEAKRSGKLAEIRAGGAREDGS